jgi:hypothetical protein
VKYSSTVEAFQAGGASAGSDQRNYLAIAGEHRNFEKFLRCAVRLFETNDEITLGIRVSFRGLVRF